MTELTIQLPDDLDSRLTEAAERRGTVKEELVRDFVRAGLATARTTLSDDASGRAPTCFDLSKDLAGCLDGGPGDLATNPAHMNGYGQ
jgi:hypothetical protein